ncbi:PAS domain-containing protein [Ilumatobacter fluminis]|uniref:sensor histidine kinase n=1 Tax=Ilumatobacter fluminis TaxID=467091 RepID=UPI00141524A2|nr:PAS domain-containing protein [Ilumatobacter fluminis]
MGSGGTSASMELRAAQVRDMYARLLQGELSGTDALAASQQMLQILMDSMANAVFWKDLNSCYMGCNKVFARFAGVEPNLLVGMSDRDMPWADSQAFSADWFIDWDKHVIETGEPAFGIIEQLRSAAGEERWLQTNKVPLCDLDGRVIGVLGTFEDITNRRRAEEELQRTLDELDERVQQRTAQLVLANESLRREVEDRVRLQAEERLQRAYAEALRDTAAAMTSTLDLDEVLRQVVTGVERVVSADLIAVVLVDADGEIRNANHRASFGYGEVRHERLEGLYSQLSILRRLGVDEGPIIIDEPMDALGAARSTLGARISVADQLMGFLFVESAVHGFYTASHAERLGAVADQAGAAVSNARLARTATEVAAAEERQRLAHELHDAVNQTLWTSALTAESLLRELGDDDPIRERVDRLHRLSRGALSEMRALLLELRPDDLTEVGLDELINYLISALECRRTLQLRVDLANVQLDQDAHHTFYRVAQEALRNVTQHAEATSVEVRLTDGPVVELCVVDDGRGFDVEQVPSGHLGVAIMRERADSIGARLSLDSRVGGGTVVRLVYRRPEGLP